MNKLTGAVAATAIAFGMGAATVAPASATDNIQPLGVQEKLNDGAGNPMIGYTVRDLLPSSDPVPHNGQLYEATLTVDAFGAWATPMIPMFNARAENSALYRVLPASGPGGAVPPGGNSTGKLYFDVVGEPPDSVVYNDGVRDLLAWIVTTPPAGSGGGPTGSGDSNLRGGAETGGGNVSGGPVGSGNAGSGLPSQGEVIGGGDGGGGGGGGGAAGGGGGGG
jgi:hypothetical protein